MRSAAGFARRMLPLHVGAHDGVHGGVDDALQEVLRLAELGLDRALRGHVAERAEDGPLLAEDGVEVAC